MKKLFKNHKINYIIIGILGLIIGGSIGIIASNYVLQANEIEYKNNKSVQEAIEELYTMAQNSGGSTETLPLGTPNVDGYKIAIPYTGNYPNIRCVYGTTENYGSVGTISGNTCYFYGTSSNQKLYYKIIATNNAGKIYEGRGSATTIETTLADNVKLGDYIYMKPDSTSYSITSDMTGCVSGLASSDNCNGINGEPQTINPSELTVWRVIRKNSDGTVDVVSENVSSTNVYFYGRTGYQNLVGSLNKIAAQYTNSDYVQSTRHMGYSNQTQNITDTSKLRRESSPPPFPSSTSSSTTSANEALGAGDMGYETDQTLVNTALGTLVAKKPSGTAINYWLASRHYDSSRSTEWGFSERIIKTNGSLSTTNLFFHNVDWSSSEYSYSPAYAIRPILTLKSTVKIVGGTGTSSDNYQLGL